MAAAEARTRRIRRSHIWTLIVSLGAGATAAITGLGEWHRIGVDLGIVRSEASLLAERSDRGQLLRQMVNLISQRWFWTERFLENYKAKLPTEVQDDTWKGYSASVVAWNENYLLMKMLSELHFGEKMKDRLEQFHRDFSALHSCIVKIHYQEVTPKDLSCKFAQGMPVDNKLIGTLDAKMDEIYGRFESFMKSIRDE